LRRVRAAYNGSSVLKQSAPFEPQRSADRWLTRSTGLQIQQRSKKTPFMPERSPAPRYDRDPLLDHRFERTLDARRCRPGARPMVTEVSPKQALPHTVDCMQLGLGTHAGMR
jgi:hypothetical protein